MIFYNKGTDYRLLLFILFLISSCAVENPIIVDEHEEQVVINGIIYPDSHPLIHVSRTSVDFDSPIPIDESAEVVLYENGNEAYVLDYIGEGKYSSAELIYKEGATYNLTVKTDGATSFAEETIPTHREIYKIEHIKDVARDMDNKPYGGVKVFISNDASQDLFFNLSIYRKNSEDEFNPISYYVDYSDTLFSRQGIELPIFTNENIQSDTIEVQLNYPSSYDYNPLIVELSTISEEYYEFLKSVYLYEQGRFPDFVNSPPPVFSVYSNIENGRGVFAGFSSVKSDTIIP